MELNTKGRYAVMAMADLAKHGGHGSVPLASIAERQQISLAYLEQLFLKLRRAGLVERAQDYPWSSAAAHCGLAPPGPLSPGRPFPGPIEHWPSWLAHEDPAAEDHLRAATRLGRPAANGDDRARLEEQLGRPVTLRPWGRPRRS